MTNRYPYTCNTCNAKVMRKNLRVVGSFTYCWQCYAAEVREAINVMRLTTK